MLDVGCGTGQLGAAIASEGFDVFGVDLSPAMVARARERGLAGTFSAVTTALPFADDSFDLALTVATLHHLETPERVAATVREMGRVVKRGGFVVLWDHNPANPVLADPDEARPPGLGRRAPGAAGRAAARHPRRGAARTHQVLRSGFTPDFLPAALADAWGWVERVVEITPGLNVLAAHNVVVARKPCMTRVARAAWRRRVLAGAACVGHLLRDTPGYMVRNAGRHARRATSPTTCTGRDWSRSAASSPPTAAPGPRHTPSIRRSTLYAYQAVGTAYRMAAGPEL